MPIDEHGYIFEEEPPKRRLLLDWLGKLKNDTSASDFRCIVFLRPAMVCV
jgi:hypothetical protein